MTEISGKANRSAKSSVERPAITAGGSLPVPLTSLVGRESEIKGICRLLEQGVRLVTLTGAPGIGKTRLGIAVAGKLSERFAGGVYFVSLAPVTDAQQVLASVAHALGIRITGEHSPAQILKNNLAGIQLLLVLDNFEHVISAAGVVAELLLALPELTVLSTSRELLSI